MRDPTIRSTLSAFLLASVTVGAAGSAQAFTCYTLLDRNDNVVYRDTLSPVDLSDRGAAGRQVLKQRGEYLMISEADRCPQVTFAFGPANTAPLSTDEFLNGIRGTSRSSVQGTQSAGSAAAATGAARAGSANAPR